MLLTLLQIYFIVAGLWVFGSTVLIAFSYPMYDGDDKMHVRAGLRGLLWCWAWPILIVRSLLAVIKSIRD